jgi:hypothetical protein
LVGDACLAAPTAPRFCSNVGRKARSQGKCVMAPRKAYSADLIRNAAPKTGDSRPSRTKSVDSSNRDKFLSPTEAGRQEISCQTNENAEADTATDTQTVILEPEAFNAEFKKYFIDLLDKKGRRCGRTISPEGMRFFYAQVNARRDAKRIAWRPNDTSEADQWQEPLRTVVAFRLLVGQYVETNQYDYDWERSKLRDMLLPMADGVAEAMVRVNEDPKYLFRALSLCNETERASFCEAWRIEVLPAIKTVEIKLKSEGMVTTTAFTETSFAPGQREDNKLAKLTECERKAYLSYNYAETKEGRQLSDREAWEYLKEHGIGDDGGELSHYQPPLRETYTDYMSRARAKLGELKYTHRGGRAKGSRSVPRQSEL